MVSPKINHFKIMLCLKRTLFFLKKTFGFVFMS